MASNASNPTVTPKMLMAILFAMFATIGGGAGVMFYLGAFKDPEVYRAMPQEYSFAYVSHKGDYSNIEPILDYVAENLKKGNIEPEIACALYLDSVSEVETENRRSKIGYLIKKNDYIAAPLEQMSIPSREVVAATFEGGTLLGSHKAYSAMRDWARANGYKLSLPAFEIYHPDGKVEYQLPIHKQ